MRCVLTSHKRIPEHNTGADRLGPLEDTRWRETLEDVHKELSILISPGNCVSWCFKIYYGL